MFTSSLFCYLKRIIVYRVIQISIIQGDSRAYYKRRFFRNYFQRKNKQNKEQNHVENGLDPFGENDDDVRRIALEMEAKYVSFIIQNLFAAYFSICLFTS